jgi:hypothetical protein
VSAAAPAAVRSVALGRGVAVVSLACLAVHLLGVMVMPHDAVLAIAMLLVAVGCATCAVSILRDGADRLELRAAVGFGAAMIILHLGAQALGGIAAPAHHAAFASPFVAAIPSGVGEGLMLVATGLSAMQVAMGATALAVTSRST